MPYVSFTPRRPCDVLGCAPLSLQHGKELANQLVIPQSALGFAQHRFLGLGLRQRRFVWTGGRQRVKNIHYLQHSGEHGDVMSFEAVWISGTVPMLVMMANDGQYFSE